ncbi:MAG: SCP2 sterol-binding domain-containing protein [Pseudomonadota bacterium]|nr:SCP2 sterol-binding domain-containing protein [Pseudomonadota bacterium]MEC8694552.1 SCP2 sterol-binding domain-containing protein [Pseudomonadota bacterium]MEE2820175.1 SCP2 sterol-binding domain-containing protein [Pseudomonadota bacterium]
MIPRLMLAGLVAASEQAISAGMRVADIQPEQLAPMVGKVLKLRVTDLDLDVWIICGEERWWLTTESQDVADVELSGTLGSLVETARSLTQPNTPLIFEDLDIRGSVGVLQTMQKTFQAMDLDWEDAVTKALGPIPAGMLIQTLRTARSQWTTSRDSMRRQTREFLRSEQKALVTDDRFSETEARITSLNRQIDRVKARIKRLEADNE